MDQNLRDLYLEIGNCFFEIKFDINKIQSLGIKNVELILKKDGQSVLKITLKKPGLLIGPYCETYTKFEELIKKSKKFKIDGIELVEYNVLEIEDVIMHGWTDLKLFTEYKDILNES